MYPEHTSPEYAQPRLKERYPCTHGGALCIPESTRQHLRAHPEVQGFLDDIAQKVQIPADGRLLLTVIEMGRVVGRSGAVAFDKPDGADTPVWFAKRVGRDVPSRVVLEGEGKEVTSLVVVARKTADSATEDREYELLTAYPSDEIAPREPADPGTPEPQLADALRWWQSHALLYKKHEGWGEPFQSTWREIMGERFPSQTEGVS